MNIHDYKISLIEALKQRNVFTEQVSGIQIRTRCPFCGDSQKKLNTGHFYLRINPDDNLPIVYNCFKCPASGILTYKEIQLLGLGGEVHSQSLSKINKTPINYMKEDTSKKEIFFQYKLPDSYDYRKLKYLEDRIGKNFSVEELQNMRVLTSLKSFLLLNEIDTITCKKTMAQLVERDYIGFLSNNSAYILFRDITDTHTIRWYKYPITSQSIGQKIFYSIKSDIDLYTQDEITINLSEGIMDCISIAHNLNNISDNVLNVAVCGKYYNSIIEYLLGMGMVGSNISIHIYADRDYTHDTMIDHYREILQKYTNLVGKIYVHYNTKEKDCGVRKENIRLSTFML